MNYKYRYTNAVFILSPEEHEIVKNSLNKGQSSVFLRNGSLMINMSLVANISETSEMTAPQEMEKLNAPLQITGKVKKPEKIKEVSAWVKKQSWAN